MWWWAEVPASAWLGSLSIHPVTRHSTRSGALTLASGCAPLGRRSYIFTTGCAAFVGSSPWPGSGLCPEGLGNGCLAHLSVPLVPSALSPFSQGLASLCWLWRREPALMPIPAGAIALATPTLLAPRARVSAHRGPMWGVRQRGLGAGLREPHLLPPVSTLSRLGLGTSTLRRGPKLCQDPGFPVRRSRSPPCPGHRPDTQLL